MSNINGVDTDKINVVHMEKVLLDLGYEMDETGKMSPEEMIVAVGEATRKAYSGDLLQCNICGGSSSSDLDACPYCCDGVQAEVTEKKKSVKRVKTDASAKQVSIESATESATETAPNGQTLKKRGRPKKSEIKEEVAVEEEIKEEVTAEEAPKKRGRQKKVAVEEEIKEEIKEEVTAEEEAPKKRGRPKKAEIKEEVAAEEVTPEEEAPKKRGRQKKVTAEESNANVETAIAVVHPVELVKMTEQDLDIAVMDVNTKVKNCVSDYWELGAKLAEIQKTKIWKQRKNNDGKPAYTTFSQFLESEIKISRTTAIRMIDVSLNYDKETMQKYGLTKLALMLQVKEEDRAEVQQALESGASVREIESHVKKQPKMSLYQGTPEQTPIDISQCSEEELEVIKADDRKRILAKANPPMTVVMKSMTREKMYSSIPSKRGKIATRLEDGPEVRIQFENDTVGTFRVEINPAGEIVLMVEIRRQTLDRLEQTTKEIIASEVNAEDLEDFDGEDE